MLSALDPGVESNPTSLAGLAVLAVFLLFAVFVVLWERRKDRKRDVMSGHVGPRVVEPTRWSDDPERDRTVYAMWNADRYPVNRDDWYRANPALGTRISEESMEVESR